LSTIDYLILKNRPKFELWERQLGEHLLSQYQQESIESKSEDERIFFQTNDLLIGIADNFFTYGKFKDSFDTTKCNLFPFGQYLYLRSAKMDVTINWGLEYNDFYLEASLLHSENIRYMTDDFWQGYIRS
jgi:hypothetical protein